MKHKSTCCIYSFLFSLFFLGLTQFSRAGNICTTPDALAIGSCVTTQVNGAGDANSPAVPGACTGVKAREEWWSVNLVAGTTYTFSYLTTTSDNPAIDIYSGACGATVFQACVNNTGTGIGVVEELVFTPGVSATYLIRVMNYGTTTMDGRFCLAVKPANDEPNTATAIVPDITCTYIAYTNAGATGSTCGTIPAPGCAGYISGDVWFSVTVPASGTLNFQGNNNLVMQDGGLAVYTGAACGVLTLVQCDDNSGPGSMPSMNLTGLTPFTTVYVRVWENGNNNNGTFSLCVYDPCSAGTPINDDCEFAETLSVFDASCTTTDGTVACATASPDANTCGNTNDDDDVWYKFVAPVTSVNITLNSVAGSSTDLYHVLYSGTCGALTSVTCSDPNSSIPVGLTIGNTYYIRVYTTTATAGQNTTFKICVTEMSPCGNPTNNDWCSDPATLTLDPTTEFNSATASTYTADNPGTPDLNTEFCGTVHNNSWYKFTASATTADFDITAVFNCPDDGIQAEVYEVTHDVNGCCTAFNSVSTCFNPGSVTTGIVNASGLTIGNEYVLMIDGYSGANCDYTIDGWSATSVLPVELIDFTGKSIGNGNHLQWKTLSETNNSHFVIERSYDGENFGSIGVEQGSGNSNNNRNYNFFDRNVATDINVYYRLKQVDFDGNFTRSNIIVIYPKFGNPVVFSPNPAKDILTIELVAPFADNYTVRTISINGSVSDQIIPVVDGINTLSITSISNLSSGIYLFQIMDSNNQIIKSEKIIKE